MPPKKASDINKVEQKKLWGRPGNTLEMGIVGLPNVGKSTTFNFLSKLSVPADNFPFCTKVPNKAKIAVHDDRFTNLCKIFKPKSQVSATLEIKDIAGLVPGASKGEGLGNAFLSHIREVDGIYHVVRAFEDTDIIHTEMEVDPIRDLGIITNELILKDIDYVEKRIADLNKTISRQNTKQATDERDILTKVKGVLESGKWVRNGEWTNKEIGILNTHLFLTAKPVIYLVNLSVADFKRKKNKWLVKIQEWVKNNYEGPIIPFSAEFERDLIAEKEIEESKQIEEKSKDKDREIESKDQQISMVNRIVKTGYKVLELIYYFTSGADEVKCWTIREGTKAPQAAGIIHTDFERGFICAEVMKYVDYIKYGSENACKNEGKLRQWGKEYVVEDGDMILFKFNVTASKK